MVEFAVRPEKNEWLRVRLSSLGIEDRDVEEKFVRGSGRGGQKVNKTSSCVYLKHVPTGVEVKCMTSRSQSLNRFLARRELADKVEALLLDAGGRTPDAGGRTRGGGVGAIEARRARIRKQKLRRKKRREDSSATPRP
jgi:protein subunit release factor B